MLKTLMLTLSAMVLVGSLTASSAAETKTYDLLFRTGTLDRIERGTELIYSRRVRNALDDQAATRGTGDVALVVKPGEPAMAELDFRQEAKHRSLGRFPASVGNPMIMYFYETVIRDMAASAGGSPFYIRNRVKEILTEQGEVKTTQSQYEGRTISVQTVRLRPFADDPNRDRMQGFDDLELRVSMSDAVPGWYLSLVAEAPNPTGKGAPTYLLELQFDRLEAVQ
ncbi:hypothetical protein [Sedimentitalea nanhaiensis]|uniref:Uncharacterized protein n=1 Tax=Sedimentitalea nanhaiensis TaxID=999627 RepID=A0A1I7E5A5_9RHOB|nr:hypothetical protein [Sedimentitalea nanhaiensis]SFU19131.1 hypothetical protein SAMN05216236_1456 [Sedimentitalea nanhaiensis]